MARVLFLTQVLPYPLYGGGAIRAYYMLRHLTQANEVTLVSFTRDDDRVEDISHLRQYCEKVETVPIHRTTLKNGKAFIQSFLNNKPIVILRDRIPAMETKLKQLVLEAPFDVVHTSQTTMAQYGIHARLLHPINSKTAIVLDTYDALHLAVRNQLKGEGTGFKRFIWSREADLLEKYEGSLLGRFDELFTVSNGDKNAFLGLVSEAERELLKENVTVIPICVDPEERDLIEPEDMGPRILHLGTMFWPPNVEGVLWFARQVLPQILQEVPEATFVIAGKNPPAEVRALAEESSPYKNNIKVTGFVPDPMDLLNTSRAFVVPLLSGTGMRVKILDAWLWGVPMVSTAIGAEGILTEPGENILLVDEAQGIAAQEFAAEVVRVLTDRALAKKLRENGRSWVEMHYDWRKEYKRVDEVYDRILAQRM